MAASPLQTIASAPMRLRQYVIVVLCCLINVIDGYDVVSLSYASPVLLKEWATPPAMLGIVFSASALGLAIGAFLLAPLADRVGRRPMMLGALVAITISHALSSVSHSINELMALRFLMGLGLGLLVVSLNVMVSEYSNDKQRSMQLAILHSGFTVGLMLGGVLAALVLEPFGWRAIFVAGTIINIVLVTLLFFLLWESPNFLVARQPADALKRINGILTGLGHTPIDRLPPKPEAVRKGANVAVLFGRDQRNTNLLFWLVALVYAVIGYFLLNWKPKVLVDAGLTPTEASWVGASVGVMGILGHLVIGWLARKGGARGLTAIFFAGIGVALLIFGNVQGAVALVIAAGLLQFFTVGSYTGLFLTVVTLYPPERRNLGMSFMVGFTRLGAMIGPFLGGILLGSGLGRAATFAIFAGLSAVPVLAMIGMIALSRGAAQRAAGPAAAAA